MPAVTDPNAETPPSLVHVREPVPPYTIIAGPFATASVDRAVELSGSPGATVTVNAAEVDQSWLRPGMCWSIDERHSTGDELWAGFIATQALPFRAETVDIDLKGPKEALLGMELAVRLPARSNRADAVRRAIEAAQVEQTGLYSGRIDLEGATVEIEVRGETVSDFIDSLTEAAAGAFWRERCVEDESGNGLRFYLDFGFCQRETGIIIGPNDLIDAAFERNPVPVSLTVLGEGVGFGERRSSSVVGAGSRAAAQPPRGTMHPASAGAAEAVRTRDIGPAAGRHVTEISDRFGGAEHAQGGSNRRDAPRVREERGSGLSAYAEQRHQQLLRGLERLALTLNATGAVLGLNRALFAHIRRLQLGDVAVLRVEDWGMNLSVDARIHIVRVAPNAGAGTRTVVAHVIEDAQGRLADVPLPAD